MSEEVKPIRIQRSRQHKQVNPNGLEIVYVGRPTKYGNPYKVQGQEGHWFVFDGDEPIVTFDNKSSALDCCIELFREFIAHEHNASKVNVFELKGKNLSCWCKIGEKCHADILLEIANNPKK
jgi:hypothetical protein